LNWNYIVELKISIGKLVENLIVILLMSE